ncbi:N-acetylmuramoyl-L-alanine amidase-like domain-containing protein [Cellulophaga sp. RHA19]|uniref:N-acetylmuramoyl-L-alanine amidase-like domain-containing protein n=1 Tax=Cellulophaga sp. RHA19 TaxID=1798237 RepID=UPI001E56AA37|nr:N-acetylmuramoyl-L-alanine amidase-like domain-containing protein [Cellulophaga sp. RHA19]
MMMKKQLIVLCTLLFSVVSFAQHITCSPKDSIAFNDKIKQIKALPKSNTFGDSLTAIGKTFLEIPYVAKTLEIGKKESLVVNLQGLDCTTFVENVLAFGLISRADNLQFLDFTNALKKIRYRDGNLDGYGSRLHYFTEWISNNETKDLVKNITNDLGGKIVKKEINFMGTHRDLYPFLKDDANYNTILESEEVLKQNEFCVLSADDIAANEHLIQTGDIIALATSIKGLDVTHTGIAIRAQDGHIHMLHASTGSMQVEITKLPLVDYLKKIKSNIGIMVARPI